MTGRLVRKGSKTVFARRAAQLQTALDAIARKVAAEGERHAQRGAYLNIYGTVPGHVYVRSNHLFNSIYSNGSAVMGAVLVELGDRADYASDVEYGTGPYTLTQQQLDAYLKTLPPGGLLRFGRTGQAYMLPGPYIGPALQLVRYRTQVEVRDLMRRLWA
ncbi:hypothetical protein [Deinococcus hopiensis]|uniref:Uncharacterized protein n=1 Tax=Deinococcus hopiensis KR-140 TaxID=695939 RepID=A0A1W1VIU6_9DEIO|nr:hypothetical protein [Deinococcus hopiensis]SMB93305.1 hypothetical protein SAMN00790413_01926 [Deinococcus hopiensis KR-140]